MTPATEIKKAIIDQQERLKKYNFEELLDKWTEKDELTQDYLEQQIEKKKLTQYHLEQQIESLKSAGQTYDKANQQNPSLFQSCNPIINFENRINQNNLEMIQNRLKMIQNKLKMNQTYLKIKSKELKALRHILVDFLRFTDHTVYNLFLLNENNNELLKKSDDLLKLSQSSNDPKIYPYKKYLAQYKEIEKDTDAFQGQHKDLLDDLTQVEAEFLHDISQITEEDSTEESPTNNFPALKLN